MILSVTSASIFEDCPRKWWFGTRWIREPGVAYGRVFGNVMHGIAERWLKEEDPFPPLWQWDRENRQRITPEDEKLLRKMLDDAVEQGLLDRHPDRMVEKEWWNVVKIAGLPFSGIPIVAKGKIDLATPDKILDHKGVKHSRWAKPERELEKEFQLLVYGYVQKHLFGRPQDEAPVTLAHLNWDRTSGRVFERSVEVPAAACRSAYEKFCESGSRMLPVLKIDEWKKVPAAIDGCGGGAKACEAFGGCGFLPVCSGQQGLDAFKKRAKLLSLPPEARLDVKEDEVAKTTTKVPAKASAPAPAKKRSVFEEMAEETEEEEEVEEEEEEEAPAPPPRKAKAPPPPVEEPEDEVEASTRTKVSGARDEVAERPAAVARAASFEAALAKLPQLEVCRRLGHAAGALQAAILLTGPDRLTLMGQAMAALYGTYGVIPTDDE